jgi:glycosyltransferase involved in cell wall biosynthesis
MEAAAMKRADLATCVSDADRAVFAEAGCDAVVIPNAIDAVGHASLGDENARKILERRGLALPGSFCLFVGSRHPPNLVAVRQMALLAADPRMRSAGMNFVTAGNCRIGRTESGALIQLGRVPEDALHALYVLSSFIVVPLLGGTGTSLKVLEAMAHGKVVVGTQAAFRGIPVSDGENAVVVDNVDQIAERINELRADRGKLAEIGREAIRFAAQYDFRRVFEPYLKILRTSQSPLRGESPLAGMDGADRDSESVRLATRVI